MTEKVAALGRESCGVRPRGNRSIPCERCTGILFFSRALHECTLSSRMQHTRLLLSPLASRRRRLNIFLSAPSRYREIHRGGRQNRLPFPHSPAASGRSSWSGLLVNFSISPSSALAVSTRFTWNLVRLSMLSSSNSQDALRPSAAEIRPSVIPAAAALSPRSSSRSSSRRQTRVGGACVLHKVRQPTAALPSRLSSALANPLALSRLWRARRALKILQVPGPAGCGGGRRRRHRPCRVALNPFAMRPSVGQSRRSWGAAEILVFARAPPAATGAGWFRMSEIFRTMV
jgi:hypothetical protein